MPTTTLLELLRAGACLVESNQAGRSANFKSILLSRLVQYHSILPFVSPKTVNESSPLEEVELATAQQSLFVLEEVQRILDSVDDDATTNSEGPSIGTRDLAQLRTLISIAFKWGIDPLLSRIIASWPHVPASVKTGPKIIDLTNTPEDYKLLSSLTSRLIALIFPHGLKGSLPQTLITTTILNQYVAALLRPCICLGWLPKSLASDSTPTLDDLRPLTMRLLFILSPAQTISTLGSVLISSPPLPRHAHKTCTHLLSRELLRPNGVRGLCTAIFEDEEASGDVAPLEKLEHAAKILTSVPAGMKAEAYFPDIIPRILDLFLDAAPNTHKRAMAFSLSRMLVGEGFTHQRLVATILLPILHDPFLSVTAEELLPTSALLLKLKPEVALSTVLELVTNVDPLPALISTLLSPILSALYSILSYLDHIKTSDPQLVLSVSGLVSTWGRVVTTTEGVDILWRIINGEGGDWSVDTEGRIIRVVKADKLQPLSLLTPAEVEGIANMDLDTNLLELYPDPTHFVRILKVLGRTDMSSEIFVRLLEAYRESKSHSDSDPMQTLLYLQLVIQMQTQLSESKGASNMLSKPEHMLTFIKHVLDSVAANSADQSLATNIQAGNGLRLDDLRLVPNDPDSDSGDSDDDTPGADIVTPDDEMTETALNLLLSVLEANTDLSARTAPVLTDIFSLLEPLVKVASESVRPLAREARMVLTARLASGSSQRRSNPRSAEEVDIQETYQKALTLLQDPVLPVRAHGLLLLRQLVSPTYYASNKPSLDSALKPAILSIFLQSIQDEDSYIFLNAVQGLAAMVNMFGKDVLKGLVEVYSQGLDSLAGSSLTQPEVDTKIRVGEALGQVIRRCGDTLSLYVDILIPPLFKIVRSSNVPTTLRTSSLSLLADCESTYSPALLPYIGDLSEAMIDLLQIESVSATQITKPKKQSAETTVGQNDSQELLPSMDTLPTSTNSKFPPLRRAALRFLSILIRDATTQAYESISRESILPSALLSRARNTLRYVSSTDEDIIVRVMAREAVEGLDQLRQALLGL